MKSFCYSITRHTRVIGADGDWFKAPGEIGFLIRKAFINALSTKTAFARIAETLPDNWPEGTYVISVWNDETVEGT